MISDKVYKLILLSGSTMRIEFVEKQSGMIKDNKDSGKEQTT